jgi:hypothetical protein
MGTAMNDNAESTSHIVEFVAEVSVAIVEVKMHQEVRHGEKHDDQHAIGEEGLSLIIE